MGGEIRRESYLLIRVHACKSALMARFTPLLRDLRHLLFGTVGKVAGVGVAGGRHCSRVIDNLKFSVKVWFEKESMVLEFVWDEIVKRK